MYQGQRKDNTILLCSNRADSLEREAKYWEGQYRACQQNPVHANTSNDAYGSEAGQNKANSTPNPLKTAAAIDSTGKAGSPVVGPDSCTFADTLNYGSGRGRLSLINTGGIYFPAEYKNRNHRETNVTHWPESFTDTIQVEAPERWEFKLMYGGGIIIRDGAGAIGLQGGRGRADIWAIGFSNFSKQKGFLTGLTVKLF